MIREDKESNGKKYGLKGKEGCGHSGESEFQKGGTGLVSRKPNRLRTR